MRHQVFNFFSNSVKCLCFRKYEDLYQRLSILEAGGIFEETRCLKPCTYRDYRFVTSGVMFQTSIHE